MIIIGGPTHNPTIDYQLPAGSTPDVFTLPAYYIV